MSDLTGVRIAVEPPALRTILRGREEDGAFHDAVARELGATLPRSMREAASAGQATLFRLGPDEWLVAAADPALQDRLRAACEGLFTAIVDVSAASVAFRIAGPAARDVLAKGCGLDLDARHFSPGMFAQTRLGAFAVLLHQLDAAPSYEIHVARSLARGLHAWLVDAGREFGVEAASPDIGEGP